MYKALIIHPVVFPSSATMPEPAGFGDTFASTGVKNHAAMRDVHSRIEEIKGLAKAIDLEVTGTISFNLPKINPASFLGSGNVEKIAGMTSGDNGKTDLIIVNSTLSPIQQRNLEKAWNTKVIDRTALILEIFGERATTKEGRLQVELAALEYQKSRLVRSWTHLERQRGGAGFMGGPGETQIETDRRIIAGKITKLKKEIEKVRKTRELGRKSRQRVPFPVIALVGYTNAGKSTLFNALTGADVFAEDLLFATLDPTMRALKMPSGTKAILSDTVGFISDIPTGLVAAFRATLEQIKYADIILHVIDASQENFEMQRKDVIATLEELGINYDDEHIFEVMNKMDICDEDTKERILRKAEFSKRIIPVSAIGGKGREKLVKTIDEYLCRDMKSCVFSIKPEDGKAISWLYDNSDVREQKNNKNGTIKVKTRIKPAVLNKFKQRFGYNDTQYSSA